MINEYQFDIVALTETWLRDDKDLLDYVKISSYNFVYRNREQKHGGGVGAYLKEKLDFKIREDLNTLDTTIMAMNKKIEIKNHIFY